jgi:hypothetical protein
MATIRVIFSIFGEDFNHEEVSKITHLLPTNTWKKGDKISAKGIYRKECCWEYEVKKENLLSTEKILSSVLNKLNKSKIKLKDFLIQNNLQSKIDIVIEIYDDKTPSVYFNRKSINILNYIGIEVDIDLYI